MLQLASNNDNFTLSALTKGNKELGTEDKNLDGLQTELNISLSFY